MPNRRKVANPLALAVLAELTAGPMHPYEIGRKLVEHQKDRDIKYNRGSLYMVVEQLAKAGFVVERETVRDARRPERTVYALTDAGRAELHDWLGELVADPKHEYPHFGVALSLLAVLEPTEAADLLERRLAALEESGRALRAELAAAAAVPWIFLVDDDYRLAQLDTELRFVSGLIDRLRDPGYLRQWREFFGGTT